MSLQPASDITAARAGLKRGKINLAKARRPVGGGDGMRKTDDRSSGMSK